MNRGRSFSQALRCAPVASVISAGSIALTLMYWSGVAPEAAMPNADAAYGYGEIWRLLTPALLHGDLLHLAFNLSWLMHFAGALEPELGARRSGMVYAALTTTSTAIADAFDEHGIGLSGLVYGLITFLAVGARYRPALQGAASRQALVLFGVWWALCIVLTQTGIWNIGNIAHTAGAAVGSVAGLALGPRRKFAIAALAVVFVAATGTNVSRAYEERRELDLLDEAREKRFAQIAELPRAQQKVALAKYVLSYGNLTLYLDPRRAGVTVPEAWSTESKLSLTFGEYLPIPVTDIAMDDYRIAGTLSFDRHPFHCTVPWTAVYYLADDTAHWLAWEEDFPPEAHTPKPPTGTNAAP